MSREEVFAAIAKESELWSPSPAATLDAHFRVIRALATGVKAAPDARDLSTLLKIAAICVRGLEHFGAPRSDAPRVTWKIKSDGVVGGAGSVDGFLDDLRTEIARGTFESAVCDVAKPANADGDGSELFSRWRDPTGATVLKVAKCLGFQAFPGRLTAGAAGMDLVSAASIFIPPKSWAKVPTGVAVEIPAGYVGLVCPRSGLASRGLTVLNGPGIIDSDYRGQIQVLLHNVSEEMHRVLPGDRIAQLVLVPAFTGTHQFVGSLEPTERGDGGFGSTGETTQKGETQ